MSTQPTREPIEPACDKCGRWPSEHDGADHSFVSTPQPTAQAGEATIRCPKCRGGGGWNFSATDNSPCKTCNGTGKVPAPLKLWAVDLMDCGRDAGVSVTATWDEADDIRKSWVATPDHERTARIYEATPGTRIGYHDPAPYLAAPPTPSAGEACTGCPHIRHGRRCTTVACNCKAGASPQLPTPELEQFLRDEISHAMEQAHVAHQLENDWSPEMNLLVSRIMERVRGWYEGGTNHE